MNLTEGVRVRIGFIKLRTGTSARLLYMWKWTFKFHIRQEIPSLVQHF